MKSVMIVFNQANTERVEYMLDKLGIRGFTFFEQVQGRGTKTGEPRRGTHTWPEMNSAVITVVEDEQVPTLLETVQSWTSETKMWVFEHSYGILSRLYDVVCGFFRKGHGCRKAAMFFCLSSAMGNIVNGLK